MEHFHSVWSFKPFRLLHVNGATFKHEYLQAKVSLAQEPHTAVNRKNYIPVYWANSTWNIHNALYDDVSGTQSVPCLTTQ